MAPNVTKKPKTRKAGTSVSTALTPPQAAEVVDHTSRPKSAGPTSDIANNFGGDLSSFAAELNAAEYAIEEAERLQNPYYMSHTDPVYAEFMEMSVERLKSLAKLNRTFSKIMAKAEKNGGNLDGLFLVPPPGYQYRPGKKPTVADSRNSKKQPPPSTKLSKVTVPVRKPKPVTKNLATKAGTSTESRVPIASNLPTLPKPSQFPAAPPRSNNTKRLLTKPSSLNRQVLPLPTTLAENDGHFTSESSKVSLTESLLPQTESSGVKVTKVQSGMRGVRDIRSGSSLKLRRSFLSTASLKNRSLSQVKPVEPITSDDSQPGTSQAQTVQSVKSMIPVDSQPSTSKAAAVKPVESVTIAEKQSVTGPSNATAETQLLKKEARVRSASSASAHRQPSTSKGAARALLKPKAKSSGTKMKKKSSTGTGKKSGGKKKGKGKKSKKSASTTETDNSNLFATFPMLNKDPLFPNSKISNEALDSYLRQNSTGEASTSTRKPHAAPENEANFPIFYKYPTKMKWNPDGTPRPYCVSELTPYEPPEQKRFEMYIGPYSSNDETKVKAKAPTKSVRAPPQHFAGPATAISALTPLPSNETHVSVPSAAVSKPRTLSRSPISPFATQKNSIAQMLLNLKWEASPPPMDSSLGLLPIRTGSRTASRLHASNQGRPMPLQTKVKDLRAPTLNFDVKPITKVSLEMSLQSPGPSKANGGVLKMPQAPVPTKTKEEGKKTMEPIRARSIAPTSGIKFLPQPQFQAKSPARGGK